MTPRKFDQWDSVQRADDGRTGRVWTTEPVNQIVYVIWNDNETPEPEPVGYGALVKEAV